MYYEQSVAFPVLQPSFYDEQSLVTKFELCHRKMSLKSLIKSQSSKTEDSQSKSSTCLLLLPDCRLFLFLRSHYTVNFMPLQILVLSFLSDDLDVHLKV